MKRAFVILPEFERQWKIMGLDDADLSRLQNQLLIDTKIGSVIKGTGRLRKMRFAFDGRGKSGSTRVLYVDFIEGETIYLITAYPKSKKESLTNEEKAILKKLVDNLDGERRVKNG